MIEEKGYTYWLCTSVHNLPTNVIVRGLNGEMREWAHVCNYTGTETRWNLTFPWSKHVTAARYTDLAMLLLFGEVK